MNALTSHWSLDPSLIYVGLAAVLYWVGGVREGAGGESFRRARRGAGFKHERLLRELSFAAGLLTIPIALCSPIDYYSDQWFWVHMGQHILLLTVAPPLILMGRPWPRMWRAIPRGVRTPTGRGLVRSPLTMPLRWLARPIQAWTLFSVDMVIWHVPKFYDLTLQHQWIHDCEHTLFFFTGLLFWAHVVDPGPIRARLSWLHRTVYVIGAMIVGWMLAIALVLYPTPLYSHYADLHHGPGLSAIGDQQVAGGMMWVLGSVSFTIAAIYAFSRWVEPEPLPAVKRAPVAT